MTATKGVFLTELLTQVSKEELDEFVELENLIDFGENESTQAFRMLKKKHELHTITSEAEEKKKNIIERIRLYEIKKDAFESKQREMAAQVERFEKFVSENDEKRKRAIRQIKSERCTLEQQMQEMAHLKEDFEMKKVDKLKVVQQVNRMNEYTKFANKFSEDTEGGDSSFQSIEDVINRSKTLLATNRSLHSTLGFITSQTEELGTQMQDLLTTSNTEQALLAQNAQALQYKLDSLRATLKDDRNTIEGQIEACTNRNKEKGKLILAIGNLHARCSQGSKMKIPPFDDRKQCSVDCLTKCLDSIADLLIDLEQITMDYKKAGT
eukprot:CAMPEP_0116033850 /NCGR_PEP_ID=MMETSP0321-20121206/19244_1 /TAXON_ID=163516 /ORGANISM="Leptocylindrus danicus var. danicus, Strain B650" /LENGTH=323 /DNA_ID=CAMNT_0003510023 /DNA_START=52 /DNA_END=1023 /DNA_ORIENTATION=+